MTIYRNNKLEEAYKKLIEAYKKLVGSNKNPIEIYEHVYSTQGRSQHRST